MTETVAPVAKPVPRPRSRNPATVRASALVLHLDCSCMYIGELAAEGMIQRQGDAFPLDRSRVAYLRYLWRERQQSSRSEADAEHVKVKTEMLQLRLMEKRRELVRRDDMNSLIDELGGVNTDAPIQHGGAVLQQLDGAAQDRRRGASGQARDCRMPMDGGAAAQRVWPTVGCSARSDRRIIHRKLQRLARQSWPGDPFRTFDTDRRELRRGAEIVQITPQVFDLLDCLIRNRDRVVGKDNLISSVWNGRIVSDAALTTRLNAARAAIGDGR